MASNSPDSIAFSKPIIRAPLTISGTSPSSNATQTFDATIEQTVVVASSICGHKGLSTIAAISGGIISEKLMLRTLIATFSAAINIPVLRVLFTSLNMSLDDRLALLNNS